MVLTINSSPLPPLADPTSLQLAAQMLAALSDPAGTKARPEALAAAQADFERAKGEHDSARAVAEAAAVALRNLSAREGKLADAQSEHDRNTTALAVASEANSKRSKDLDERARAVDAQAADLQRRTTAFDARVKEFRDQLAG
jgi:chromosome segregation ATPase